MIAQYDTPEQVLRAPVDGFVAEFVGRDRGFRALEFDQADVVLSGVRVRDPQGSTTTPEPPCQKESTASRW